MDNIRLLISRYLDGELTDEEIVRLAEALRTDIASIDRLVFNSFIHAQLLNWMDQQSEQGRDNASIVDENDLCDTTGLSAKAPSADEARKVSLDRFQPFFNLARRRFLSFGTLAATLLIAASISVVAYVISSRPVHIGQLTDATGCKWGASQPDIQVGTLLENGQQLDLVQGRAVITFASGAKVLMEGPTTLQLVSPTEIRLIGGNIAAKVPRPAIGFTVSTSLARIVDLGTAFTLMLNAEKSFSLHVFEGLVEVQLDERFGEAVHQPVRVAEIRAVTFDIQSGDIMTLPFEEGKEMPF